MKYYYIDAHLEQLFPDDMTKKEIYKKLKEEYPCLHIDSVEEL